MLKEVGITVNINALEFAQYFNKTYKYRYEMAFHITTAGVDPEEWLVPYFGKPDKSTYYKWSNHELWDMIEKQAHIMDQQKRVAYIKEIQRKVMDEAMSQSMFTTRRYTALKPYVHEKFYMHEGQRRMYEFTWMEKH
jgi:peptide/nickel transport system substrate-binding protein